MSQQTLQTEAASLKREHASLIHEIDEWRDWWRELAEMGQPHFGEMGDRLAQFRDHLAAHFAHEKKQDYRAMDAELPVEKAGELARLRVEHAALLDDLDQLVDELQKCEPEIGCWSDARYEFEEFLNRLYAHEDAEDALLDLML